MQATTPRATFSPGPEGLAIVIPAARNWIALLVLGLWLIGWLVGEVTALAAVMGILVTRPAPGGAFLLIWLALWTIGGLCAACSWVWMLGGAETALMGASTLTLKRAVFGVGASRAYELHRMRNLRVILAASAARAARSRFGWPAYARRRIAFEYDGAEIRFGAALADSDAQAIVDRMKARFAFPEMPTAVREHADAV